MLYNIVTWGLKARILEREVTSIAMLRHGKHVMVLLSEYSLLRNGHHMSAATLTHATIENCWRQCFLPGPCGGYIRRPDGQARLGESRIWDSKIRSRVPRDSGLRMTVLARASNNCKRQTRPLVRESAPHQQTRNCLAVIKIW
jgi:hypothetical protein